MNNKSYSSFPIPVVSLLGPGSQPADDGLEYMDMPKGMETYKAPILPEPEELATCKTVAQIMHRILDTLRKKKNGENPPVISVMGLEKSDVTILNQILGEGEVAINIHAEIESPELVSHVQSVPPLMASIQESIFAGVWRVLIWKDGVMVDDYLEVANLPSIVKESARQDWQYRSTLLQHGEYEDLLPEGASNIASLLAEVKDHCQRWKPGQDPHIINFTLLPVSPEDIAYMDYRFGTGRIVILSRGYGNCRIVNTLTHNTWRVVYYNSQDVVILNTVEIVDAPEVACAMPQDIEDSCERLEEVIDWLEQSV